MTKAIVKALAVANLAMGGDELEADVVRVYLSRLTRYPEADVLAAIGRCVDGCRGQLRVSDIISRIRDGWPTGDEAWALCPHSEADTVVWCDEIARAFEAVRGEPDRVAARMAFKGAYQRELDLAREAGRAPSWHPSIGHDVGQRERVLAAAIEAGRLCCGDAERLLPPHEQHDALPAEQVERLLETWRADR